MTHAQETFARMLLAMMGDEEPTVETDEHYDPREWGLDDEATYYDNLAMDMDEEAIYRTGGI